MALSILQARSLGLIRTAAKFECRWHHRCEVALAQTDFHENVQTFRLCAQRASLIERRPQTTVFDANIEQRRRIGLVLSIGLYSPFDVLVFHISQSGIQRAVERFPGDLKSDG